MSGLSPDRLRRWSRSLRQTGGLIFGLVGLLLLAAAALWERLGRGPQGPRRASSPAARRASSARGSASTTRHR